MSATSSVPYPSVDGAQCPYPWYEHLRASAPVFNEPGTNRYYILNHEDVMRCLRDIDVFSVDGRAGLAASARAQADDSAPLKAPQPARSMILLDGPEHKAARDVGFIPIKPGRVRAAEAPIRAEADRLLDPLMGEEQVEFVSQYAGPLVAFSICHLLGLPTSMVGELFERVGRSVEGSGFPYLPKERQERDIANWKWAIDFFRSELEDRAANPRDDGLSLMIQFQTERDGAFDLDYVLDQTSTIFIGALPTTVHLMSNLALAFARDHQLTADVRDKPPVLTKIIEEMVRLETPVQWVARRVLSDTKIQGFPIPANSFVLLFVGAANREAEVFECPAELHYDRSNISKHAGFGYGPHFCVGAPLGRFEARLAFEQLFKRVARMELMPTAHITYVPSPSFRGPETVPVRFVTA